DVLRHVLASSAWRPGLIAVVSDSVPLGAAAECDGVPVVAVPTEHTPDAWWAMAAHGIKGVLAVGVPPDLLEELSQKAFPLGVYGLQAGLLPGTAGPAALNWALIRGLTETGTSLVRYTKDGDGWLLVSQLPCRIEDGETAGTLCAKLSAASADLWARHWPGIARNDVALRPAGTWIRELGRRPEDGAIRWAEHSAASLDRWIRALARPYPGAFLRFGGRRIWVHRVERDTPEGAAVDAPTLTAVSARGLTLDFPDGRIRISDLSLDDGSEIPGHLLAALAERVGANRLDRCSNLELMQALERQIQEFQPHVIYTHWWGDVNADHARVAEAVDVAALPYSAPGLKSIYAFETPSSTEWTASARGRA